MIRLLPLTFLVTATALLSLDSPPAMATATSIEVTLDRATAWRSRSKLGRIKAEGTLREIGGPSDKGLIVVTVTDGQDLDESGTFTSCREYSSGTIRCQNDDRSARIRYIPDRNDPGLFRYKLDYRKRDITEPQVAPLQVLFDYAGGSAQSAAQNEPCVVLNAKLVCKGSSTPVCLPSPEICDGVDNDCNGQVDDNLALATCGIGECASTEICDDGILLPCEPGTPVPEVCSDALDNDCDGDVDDSDADCVTCPCEGHWNDGIGAPPLSTADLSDFDCYVFPISSGSMSLEAFSPDSSRETTYEVNNGGSLRGQCYDRSRSGGASFTNPPWPVFSQSELDVCQSLLEAQGCVFP